MVIDSLAYDDLICDNYKHVRGKWVKMSKEEAEAYDKDTTIAKRQPIDSEESSSFDLYNDIDEFEYNEGGHAIFPL